jgi:cystathionine beta-lyase/cystathionine gamma-synthase
MGQESKMITTRNDLSTAKQMMDNLDQINAALAALALNSGTVTISAIPQISIKFAVADLVAFLTSVRDKIVLSLSSAFGVTSL